MHFRCRSSLLFSAAFVLTLIPGESGFAQLTRHKTKQPGVMTRTPLDPQVAVWAEAAANDGAANMAEVKALLAAQQLNRISQCLPGNENTWFVLVFQDKTSAEKSRKFVLVQGRTAAAQTIFSFYCDGKQSQKKFQYRAFGSVAQAMACYKGVLQYNWQAGYR